MKRRTGREKDCYELCQLPMALLKELPRQQAPMDAVTFAADRTSWTIWPHPTYGMPGPLDMELYVMMVQLTWESQLPETVEFAPVELLRRLGWGTGGEDYARLRLALIRWQETTYVHAGIVEFKGRTDIVRDRFKVLSHVQESERGLVPWSFTWSQAVHWMLLNSKHHLDLDTAFYLSLDSPIARAVYRYLLGRCWETARYPDGYWETLVPWANNRLGIRQKYASKVKQNLLPALKELVAKGFLAGFEVHDDCIGFFFPHREPRSRAQTPEKRALALPPAPETFLPQPGAETAADRSARILARELAKR